MGSRSLAGGGDDGARARGLKHRWPEWNMYKVNVLPFQYVAFLNMYMYPFRICDPFKYAFQLCTAGTRTPSEYVTPLNMRSI